MPYDYRQGLVGAGTGALSGAASGAATGSIIPGIGTGVGALGGGLLGLLSGLLSGIQQGPPRQHHHRHRTGPSTNPNNITSAAGGAPSPAGSNLLPMSPEQERGNFLTGTAGYGQQLPRFGPLQEAALHLLLGRGLEGSDFGPIEQRARTQFEQQTVPSLAERFTSLGAGAQSSPAFAQTLGQAGAGLEEGLAALRSQYALQQLQLALSPLYENIYIPGKEGAGVPLLQSLASSGPEYLQILRDMFRQQGQVPQQQPGQQQSPIPITVSSQPEPFQLPTQSNAFTRLQAASNPQTYANQFPQQQPNILTSIQGKKRPNIFQMTQAANNPAALAQILS